MSGPPPVPSSRRPAPYRPAEETVLETAGLTKHFGGVHAVNDVDLRVGEGTITALIGPNGAGKTTVFNLITGMYPVTRGRITFTPPGGEGIDLVGRRTD